MLYKHNYATTITWIEIHNEATYMCLHDKPSIAVKSSTSASNSVLFPDLTSICARRLLKSFKVTTFPDVLLMCCCTNFLLACTHSNDLTVSRSSVAMCLCLGK